MLKRAHFVTGHKYAAALATELAAPLLRLAARARTGPPLPPSEWRRGLVLGHTHIGDVLYRTASLPHLRAGLPNCEWDVLAAPASAPVLRGNPHVNEVLALNAGDQTWQLAPGGFSRLRDRRYDVVLATNSLDIHVDLLLATALGIPARVAFTYKGMSGLTTHPVPVHFPDTYPGYVRQIVAHATSRAPDWDLTPQIFLDDADAAEADRVWAEEGLDEGEPPIACSPTGRQRGVWPIDRMLAPVRLLHEELGAPVVLCGLPGEADVLAEAARRAGLPARVLAGRLSLRGFAAFVRRCRLLVASDSGPRHVGNAVGVPVAFTPNLTARRSETGPYCENELDLGPGDEIVPRERIPDIVSRYPARDAADRMLAFLATREAGAGSAGVREARC